MADTNQPEMAASPPTSESTAPAVPSREIRWTRWAVTISWRDYGQHMSVGTIAIFCYSPSLNAAFLAVVAVCAIVAAWHYSIPDAHSQLFEVKLAQERAQHAEALKEERKKLVRTEKTIAQKDWAHGLLYTRGQELLQENASLNRQLAVLGHVGGGQAQWQQRIRAIQTAAENYRAENEALRARLAAIGTGGQAAAGAPAGNAGQAAAARTTPVPEVPVGAPRNPSPLNFGGVQEDTSLPALPEVGHAGPGAQGAAPVRPAPVQQARQGQVAGRVPANVAARLNQNRARPAAPAPATTGPVVAPFAFPIAPAAPQAAAPAPASVTLPVVAAQATQSTTPEVVPPPPAAATAFTGFGAWGAAPSAPAPAPAPAAAVQQQQPTIFNFNAPQAAPAPAAAPASAFTFGLSAPSQAAAPAPAPAAPLTFTFGAAPAVQGQAAPVAPAPAPPAAPAPAAPVSVGGAVWPTFSFPAASAAPAPAPEPVSAPQDVSFVCPDAENAPFGGMMRAPSPIGSLAPIQETGSSAETDQQPAAAPITAGNLFIFSQPAAAPAAPVPAKPTFGSQKPVGQQNIASIAGKKPVAKMGTGIGLAARVPVKPTSVLDALVPASISETAPVPVPGSYVPPQNASAAGPTSGSVGLGKTGFKNNVMMRNQQQAASGAVKPSFQQKMAIYEDVGEGSENAPTASAFLGQAKAPVGAKPLQNASMPQVGQPAVKTAAPFGFAGMTIPESDPQPRLSAGGTTTARHSPEEAQAIARQADQMIEQAYATMRDWNPRQLLSLIRTGGRGVWGFLAQKDKFVELCIVKGLYTEIKQLSDNSDYHPDDQLVKRLVLLALCWDAWGNKLSAEVFARWITDNGMTSLSLSTFAAVVLTKEGKKNVRFQDAIKSMPCMAPSNASRPSEAELQLLSALQQPLPPAAGGMPTEQELAAIGQPVMDLNEQAMDCGVSPIRPAVAAC